MRLLESHGIFTDLYQAIVRMHPNFNFFFLNYPFTAWGVAASRAQHLAKSFTPSSIPTIPARMKTHITADSKKTDTAARRPTPPPEDTTPTPKEIDTSDSEKTDTATRRHHRRHRGDRRHRIREERRHQKNNHHYPRNAESILYQTLPPHPTPKQAKAKAKANSKQFFFTSKHQQRNNFFSTPFHFFFNFFQNKRVTTGPLKFLCTQLHKNTLYPSTPYDIFVNIGSFPKSRLSQSKNFPFHPFKVNQIKYSSTSCCRKLLSLFI